MTSNPMFEDGPEYGDEQATRQPARHETSRSHWPDDGLPPRFASERTHSPLHPFGLIGAVMGRR
ncbi:hypothetical protein BH10ACT11_BH10ACT11_18670 [soil metagenome]